MTLIESVLLEQIAALNATAALCIKRRADSLAAAESASVQEAGAHARAAELQTELDAYRALLPPAPEPDPTPETAPAPLYQQLLTEHA